MYDFAPDPFTIREHEENFQLFLSFTSIVIRTAF